MGPTTLGGPLILLANIRAMQWGPLLLWANIRAMQWGPLLLWANIRAMQWGPLLLLKRAYISGNAKFAGRVRVSLSDCIVDVGDIFSNWRNCNCHNFICQLS